MNKMNTIILLGLLPNIGSLSKQICGVTEEGYITKHHFSGEQGTAFIRVYIRLKDFCPV
jgi:hypothetical protein